MANPSRFGTCTRRVHPRTRHLSRRVRAFVDFLAERFAGVP
jgi:DNA-binding transcriptional LysR family regulator